MCSSDLWLEQANARPDLVLIDHAHCERKAAGVALQLMFRYPSDEPLATALSALAREELEHFEQVLALLWDGFFDVAVEAHAMLPALARLASQAVSRRTFLVASAGGAFGFNSAVQAATSTPRQSVGGKAKSTILFFLCGGASHVDTWDMKPNAPDEIRGPFKPIETTAPGVRLCEHLPLLAKQMNHVAVVNSLSVSVPTNDHHAGYYYNLTGHAPDPSFVTLGNDRRPYPDDWPYVGCVVGAKRPLHPFMPNVITLPYKPSQAPYTRPGQFAARIGVEYDPLYVQSTRAEPLKFVAPSFGTIPEVFPNRMVNKLTAKWDIPDSNLSPTPGA